MMDEWIVNVVDVCKRKLTHDRPNSPVVFLSTWVKWWWPGPDWVPYRQQEPVRLKIFFKKDYKFIWKAKDAGIDKICLIRWKKFCERHFWKKNVCHWHIGTLSSPVPCLMMTVVGTAALTFCNLLSLYIWISINYNANTSLILLTYFSK